MIEISDMDKEPRDINLTEHEKIIKAGTFECLNGPQSVFWGWSTSRDTSPELPQEIAKMPDSAEKDFLKEKFIKEYEAQQEEIAKSRQQKIINAFNKYGLNAVSDEDPRAADLTTIVISKTGLRTPFVHPDDAKQVALMAVYVAKYMSGVDNFDTMSYASCLSIDRMADPLEKGTTQENNRLNSAIGLVYPCKKDVQRIFSQYGNDFVERKLTEARNSNHLLTSQDIKKLGLLYRGQQDARDDLVMFRIESKAVNLATIDLDYANYFPPIKKANNESYGFIFCYTEYKGQLYFDDYGFEEGQKTIDKTLKINDNNIKTKPETVIISPGLNKKEVELLKFIKDGEMRYFIIPQNDAEWQAFKQLHTQADLTENENLVNRVLNAKREAEENGGNPKIVNWLERFTPEVLQQMNQDMKKMQPDVARPNLQKTEDIAENEVPAKKRVMDINQLRGVSGTQNTGKILAQKASEQPQTHHSQPKKSMSAKDKVVALFRLSRGKVKKFARQTFRKTSVNQSNISKGGRE